MKTVRISNATRGGAVCERCQVADTMWARVRGLLGRSGLAPDEGLLITPCPSIHMFGMKFPIDVLFLTRDNIVTDTVQNIAPGKVYLPKPHNGKAHAALEIAAGAIARSNAQIGDALLLEPVVEPAEN